MIARGVVWPTLTAEGVWHSRLGSACKMLVQVLKKSECGAVLMPSTQVLCNVAVALAGA